MVAHQLRSFKQEGLVEYLSGVGVLVQQAIVAEVTLSLAFFDEGSNDVVVADELLPLVEPASRNQVKLIVKFAPIRLI